MLVSTYALCQLFSGPMLGRLSDHMGRRPLLLVSQVGTFIGFLILANAGALWVVFLSRIIDGATAGNLSLAQAYISDVTTPDKRAKSFAIIGIAFGLGFLVGPAISGYLVQYGYPVPIYVAAGLSFTSILCTYFLLVEKKAEHAAATPRPFAVLDWGNYVRFFREPGLGSLLWQFFAFTVGFSGFMSGFALFAERRYVWNGHPFGTHEVGYVYAFVGLLGIVYQGGLVGRLVHLLGERRMARIAWAVAVVGYAWVGLTWTVPWLLAAAAVQSFGSGSLRPVLTSLITQKAGRSETGAVLGLTQSLNSVSQIVAPFIAGLLIQKGLLVAWAMFPALAALVGFLL
jgi:MFS family permease